MQSGTVRGISRRIERFPEKFVNFGFCIEKKTAI